MLTIYGTKLCPDCVQCLADLDAAGVAYEYLDFFDDLRNLKAFLKLRDNSPIFNNAKENGNIGIPCLVNESGELTLDWSCYVGQDNA